MEAVRLRDLVDYDRATGLFSDKSGKAIGHKLPNGYTTIYLDGRTYFAHRLAWLHAIGSWPDDEVDHIDGNRSNNAMSNLRQSSRVQNCANVRMHRDNASGFEGVFFNKRRSTWHSQVCVRGIKHHLGTFKTAEDAHEAYKDASQRLSGEYARAA